MNFDNSNDEFQIKKRINVTQIQKNSWQDKKT